MQNSARRGPGRPPAAKSAETRGRILQTAREVFSEVGYEAATFQEIAHRADLTRPAINHYFPSKRALYDEVVVRTNDLVIGAGAAEAAGETTFLGRIRAFLRAALGAQDQERSAAAFLMTSVLESQRHPELREHGNGALDAARGFVARAVEEAKTAGELRADIDCAAAAEMLVAMLLGLGLYAGYIGTQPALVTVTEEFVRMLRGESLLQTP